jgi:hypothetical protein
MPERLSIWNQALGHIGEGTVLADLADPSTPGREIRRHYDAERDSMLEGFPWRFAERPAALTPHSPAPPGTTYAYKRPGGSLRIIKVSASPERDAPSVPWRIGGATNEQDDDEVLILADQPNLYAIFTKRVTQEASWPHLFAKAMAWRLAWAISYPLTRDLARREECWRQFLVWQEEARAEDQRQSYQHPPESAWITARNGVRLDGFGEDDPEFQRFFPVA